MLSDLVQLVVAALPPLMWALALLASWNGWGYLCNRILFPTRRADWGLQTAWGIAFSIAVGGLANLSGLVSRPFVFAFVLFGFVIWLANARRWLGSQLKDKHWESVKNNISHLIEFLIPLSVILLFIVKISEIASGTNTIEFNSHDDFLGYLIFPVKMLEVGFQSPDPFNVHQMYSLGGQAWLQVLALAALPVSQIRIVDPVLMSIVSCALLYGQLRRCNAKPLQTAFVSVLPLLLLGTYPIVNISALGSLMCLILALYRTLDWCDLDKGSMLSKSLAIALSASSIVTLKQYALIHPAVILSSYYMIYLLISNNKKFVIIESFTTASIVALLLFPWMLMMYVSSGTFYYPVLGAGFAGEAYGTLPAMGDFEWGTLLDDRKWLSVVALAVVCAPYLFRKPSASIICFVVGSVLGTFIMITAGASEGRFTWPFTMASILILLGFLFGTAPRWAQLCGLFILLYSLWGGVELADGMVLAVAVIAGFAILFPRWLEYDRFKYAAMVAFSLVVAGSAAKAEFEGIHSARSVKQLVNEADWTSLNNAQRQVPAGKNVLVYVTSPFVLDYKRNRIYSISWAHGASPPPGMPLRRGSEALADYLLSNSIRYVLYQPKHTAPLYEGYEHPCATIRTGAELLKHVNDLEEPYWCAINFATADLFENFRELMKTRRLIFDDNRTVVIDLKNTP